MPVITDLVCAVCGAQRQRAWGGICLAVRVGRECGSDSWVLGQPKLDPADPFGVVALHDAPEPLKPRQYSSPLSKACGGIVPGYTILVSGEKGVGKSTLCAQLGAEMTALAGLLFWADADQGGDPRLVAELFRRTSSQLESLRLVTRRMEPNVSTWEALVRKLSRIAQAPDVCVFDSLQKWAPTAPGIFLEQLRNVPGTKLVISRNNKAGTIYGPTESEYEADAVAIVYETKVEVPQKCRWTRTPSVADRPELPQLPVH